jgi:hypothetical protein
MSHFAKFSPTVKDYSGGGIGSAQLVFGDEAIYVLWGGGPPPKNEALSVSLNPAGLGTLVEVAPINSINRKFRFIANGTATTGSLEGRYNGSVWASLNLTIGDGPPAQPKKQTYDLYYNGTSLSWPARSRTYNATSGLDVGNPQGGSDSRDSQYSCVKDFGPVPEGIYTLSTVVDPKTYATADFDQCKLDPGTDIQKIPRGAMAKSCESYWVNWGTNRVRLTPADGTTRDACTPVRDGFYLHDSTKGFSHGCVELDTSFFTDLYDFSKSSTHHRRLTLEVKYTSQSTYGGTKKP